MSKKAMMCKSFVCLALLLWPSTSVALDRLASLGVSLSPTKAFKPNSVNKLYYSIDTAFYLGEFWGVSLNWNIGIGENQDNDNRVLVGLVWYLSRHPIWMPHFLAHFAVETRQTSSFGWNAALGLEVNLRRVSGMDNLRWYIQSGYTHLLPKDAPSELEWNIVRSGLAWHF